MARNKSRRRRGTPGERAAVEAQYKEAVDRLQRIAYWNLRSTAAAVCVGFGIVSMLSILWGVNDGEKLWPTLVVAVGGVCGAGVYFSRPYPKLLRALLIAAVSLTILGMVGLAIVSGNGS